jgi:hypothetical protein
MLGKMLLVKAASLPLHGKQTKFAYGEDIGHPKCCLVIYNNNSLSRKSSGFVLFFILLPFRVVGD